MTVTGGDPVIMLEEPIGATRLALKRSGMKIEDIDLYEINEAFASVPLAWLRGVDADPERMNVNGGAIALGHPLGATGAKLDDDAAERVARAQEPLWAAGHVRGRRPRQRDHHRGALSGAPRAEAGRSRESGFSSWRVWAPRRFAE